MCGSRATPKLCPGISFQRCGPEVGLWEIGQGLPFYFMGVRIGCPHSCRWIMAFLLRFPRDSRTEAGLVTGLLVTIFGFNIDSRENHLGYMEHVRSC